MTTPDQSFEELLTAYGNANFDCGQFGDGAADEYHKLAVEVQGARNAVLAAHETLKLAVRQAETSQRELEGHLAWVMNGQLARTWTLWELKEQRPELAAWWEEGKGEKA